MKQRTDDRVQSTENRENTICNLYSGEQSELTQRTEKMDIKGIFTKNYIIGIDIGSSFVKIAQLASKDDSLSLIKMDLKEIHKAVAETGKEEEVLFALRELTSGVDIKRSKIIVNINCQHTAIKKIIAPYMPKTELMEGIKLETRNYFPFTTLDESIFDCHILGEVVENGVRKYEVIIAVSPQKTVEKYLSLLGKLGIKPASLICSSYALQKISEHLHSCAIGACLPARQGSTSGAREDKTVCLIDIGERYTELIITSSSGGNGPELVFGRKIPVAGADFTSAMTGVLVSDRGKTELSIPEAEKVKCEIGVPGEDESRIIDNKISTTQILSMLRSSLERLANEVERCFDYYREETSGGKIDCILLFGGGASLKGLKDFLSKSLGMEVAIGNAFEGIKMGANLLSLQGDFPNRLELAVGAALTGAAGINLLPIEKRQEVRRSFHRAFIQSALISIILAAIFVYTGMKIQLGNLHKRIAVGKVELDSIGPQLEEALNKSVANRLLSQEPYWEDVFKEISNLIPEEICLREAIMEEGNFIMKGFVISQESSPLTGFMQALEKGLFRNVNLVNIRDMGQGEGMEFEISCRIK